MEAMMDVLQVEGAKHMPLRQAVKPRPGAHEVLVRVAYCGICGSDLPRYFDGAVHNTPQILGHEFSGVIDELGEGCNTCEMGDRVVGVPFSPCGACGPCRSGRPQLCGHYGFIGSHEPGAFAQWVIVPEQNIIPVPDGVNLKEAALVEPFTVALHSVERLPPLAGEKALVLGVGTIGLMTVAALRARGVGNITVVDVNQERLDFALKIGADDALNAAEMTVEEYFTVHSRPQLVYETAGNPKTQVQAITLAAPAGRVVYVGTSHRDITFKPREFEMVFRRELIVTGNMMSYNAPFPGTSWATALDYMRRGSVALSDLITSVWHLEDGAAPFEALVASDSKEIKALYEIGGEL